MQTTFLGERASCDAQRVGAKAATLSQLAARYRVPAGFCSMRARTRRWHQRSTAIGPRSPPSARCVAIVKRTLSSERPALTDAQVREVARLTIALEAESGAPVDIACALVGPSPTCCNRG